MADSAFHFLAGLSAGSLCFIGIILGPWRKREKLALPLRNWLILSYASAVLAIVPNLLSYSGIPLPLCRGWWMNIFFFHPAIDSIKDGGRMIGQIGIALLFCLQYMLILSALAGNRRLRGRKTGDPAIPARKE